MSVVKNSYQTSMILAFDSFDIARNAFSGTPAMPPIQKPNDWSSEDQIQSEVVGNLVFVATALGKDTDCQIFLKEQSSRSAQHLLRSSIDYNTARRTANFPYFDQGVGSGIIEELQIRQRLAAAESTARDSIFDYCAEQNANHRLIVNNLFGAGMVKSPEAVEFFVKTLNRQPIFSNRFPSQYDRFNLESKFEENLTIQLPYPAYTYQMGLVNTIHSESDPSILLRCGEKLIEQSRLPIYRELGYSIVSGISQEKPELDLFRPMMKCWTRLSFGDDDRELKLDPNNYSDELYRHSQSKFSIYSSQASLVYDRGLQFRKKPRIGLVDEYLADTEEPYPGLYESEEIVRYAIGTLLRMKKHEEVGQHLSGRTKFDRSKSIAQIVTDNTNICDQNLFRNLEQFSEHHPFCDYLIAKHQSTPDQIVNYSVLDGYNDQQIRDLVADLNLVSKAQSTHQVIDIEILLYIAERLLINAYDETIFDSIMSCITNNDLLIGHRLVYSRLFSQLYKYADNYDDKTKMLCMSKIAKNAVLRKDPWQQLMK